MPNVAYDDDQFKTGLAQTRTFRDADFLCAEQFW